LDFVAVINQFEVVHRHPIIHVLQQILSWLKRKEHPKQGSPAPSENHPGKYVVCKRD
jgi:hypothetical protein